MSNPKKPIMRGFTDAELKQLAAVTKGTNWRFQISKVPDRWVYLDDVLSRLRAAEAVLAVIEESKDLKNMDWFDKAWKLFRVWRTSKGERNG